MANETKMRLQVEMLGGNKDKFIGGMAILSDVPTQQSGPIEQVFATALSTALINTVSAITGTLILLAVKALQGSFWIDPYSTAVSTAASCYLPEGQMNLYTYETAVTVVPSAVCNSAGSILEYGYAAVT